MSIYKNLFVLAALISATIIFNPHTIFPMQNQEQTREQLLELLTPLRERVTEVYDVSNEAVFRVNESLALAHSANGTSIDAFEKATEVLNGINRLSEQATHLEREYNRLNTGLSDEIKMADLEQKIQIERTIIDEKHKRGIYEQEEKIRAQASIDAEKVKWNKIHEIVADSGPIIKIALAITLTALSIYTIKYSIPALIHYFTQPYVISETSKTGWFDWGSTQASINLDDLIFDPVQKKQLFDLALRMKSAKVYNENLPNILLHGAPGTGKTALAKALAYYSGLDYALTSGSEFAKITSLDSANNQLRHLLHWAQNSNKGLIVFIDEAESLFANRKLPTTPKATQDFINTFLALVPEKSQKNVLFIFATNHPFKLDDALTSRVGITLQLPLPEAPEREKILGLYLEKFAQENKDIIVTMHPEIIQALAGYAQGLKGLSPRAIKFVAEEMIVTARRQISKQLTHDIAQKVLAEAKNSLQETAQWERERDQWLLLN